MNDSRFADNKAWFLVLPATLLVAFASLIPFMAVINYSLQIVFSMENHAFIGWDTFREALTSDEFRGAFFRQVIYTAIVLGIEVPLGIAVALTMPRAGRAVGPVLVVLALPLLVPWNVVGLILTPFRTSDINSKEMGHAAPYLGDLVEFFRSPAHKYWTPTGVNVPAYGKLTSAWWKNIAQINSGELSPQEGMDKVAEDMDNVFHRIQIAKLEKVAPPKLNEKKSKEYWFKQPGAPKPKLDNEDPPGETLPYEELLKVFNNPEKLS